MLCYAVLWCDASRIWQSSVRYCIWDGLTMDASLPWTVDHIVSGDARWYPTLLRFRLSMPFMCSCGRADTIKTTSRISGRNRYILLVDALFAVLSINVVTEVGSRFGIVTVKLLVWNYRFCNGWTLLVWEIIEENLASSSSVLEVFAFATIYIEYNSCCEYAFSSIKVVRRFKFGAVVYSMLYGFPFDREIHATVNSFSLKNSPSGNRGRFIRIHRTCHRKRMKKKKAKWKLHMIRL